MRPPSKPNQPLFQQPVKALAERWRPVDHLSDVSLEKLIREDQIDVLVEMSGHAAGHRLPVVARRVAPVQVKWVGGQFNAMGVDAIDYFLSDSVESPPEDDALYQETIYRLPDAYACYDPPIEAPPVSELPALKNGFITFGSLNKSNKLNDETLALWSHCLKQIEDSRLILQSDVFADASVVARAKASFAAHGIEESRLEFRAFTPHPTLFESYHDIDIALDPHPYSGCLTTCEAMWMGVPVITLPGSTFAGRHSASFLTAVGLTDWIVGDQDAYVARLKEKAADLKSLASLRSELRQCMLQSPLCNAERFASNLETALFEMWRTNKSDQRPV